MVKVRALLALFAIVPPLPVRFPTETFWSCRLRIPPLTVSGPLVAPRAAALASWSMPVSTVVPPP